jgi:hypothetical protein
MTFFPRVAFCPDVFNVSFSINCDMLVQRGILFLWDTLSYYILHRFPHILWHFLFVNILSYVSIDFLAYIQSYCAQKKYRQLPGSRTSWNWSAEKGGTGGRGGQSSARPPYWEGRRSARIQQRWRKHDEGQRGIYSGRDAGGSVANRVRISPIHS